MTKALQRLSPWNWLRREHERNRDTSSRSGSSDALARLHRELDRWFEDWFSDFSGPRALAASLPAAEEAGWLRPHLDIAERDNAYVISVEMPGVEQQDIEVSVLQGVLTISGEKHRASEQREDRFHRIERSYGTFLRELTLPEDADEGGIRARFKNGVLTITVPRRADAKTTAGRKIPVQSGS